MALSLKNQPELIHAKTNDHFHYSALHRASQLGHAEIVEILLRHGANIHELSDRVSWRPFLLAAKHGHTRVVRLLLQAGEDVNVQLAYTKNKFTCLHFAAQYGHTQLAHMLLKEYGARYDISSANGLRPIHTAANFGNFEIVDMILSAGEDINKRHKSPWRYAPLHWAVQENRYQTVELLLRRGADVNAITGNTNLTPLIQCATKNLPHVAKLLLSYGANHRITNKNGLRAVHVAAANNSRETLCVILDHLSPCEMYACGRNGHEDLDALRFAVKARAVDCVEELVQRWNVNTNGVMQWMEDNDLLSPGACPIIDIIRQSEAAVIAKRGALMRSCASTRKFVDVEILTQD